MYKQILSLLLTGTILAGATTAVADIAISPELGPSEYTESYTKFVELTDGTIVEQASDFPHADRVYLNVKSAGYAAETDGNNIIHVDSNTEGNSAFSVIFNNYGYLSTKSRPVSAVDDGGGHIFYMDTRPTNYVDLSGSRVRNYGTMSTDGTGYAVYANPLENQNMTTTVSNAYTMDRINLYRTDSSQVSNGDGILSVWDDDLQKYVEGNYFVEGATINGSVLLGTNSYLFNHGLMQNKANDYNHDFVGTPFSSNSIWLDRHSEFQNGFAVSSHDGILNISLLKQNAAVTTDNIYFKQTGELYSAGLIDNEFIGAGDSFAFAEENPEIKYFGTYVRLLNDPYYETDASTSDYKVVDHLKYLTHASAGTLISGDDTFEYTTDAVMATNNRSDLRTKTLATGDWTRVYADMGSYMCVQNMALGEKASFELGRQYFLGNEFIPDNKAGEDGTESPHLEVDITVGVQHKKLLEYDEDRKQYLVEIYTDPDERTLEEIPHRTEAHIDTATLGNQSSFTLSNMAELEGKSISMGDDSSLSVTGGSLNLSNYVDVKGSNQANMSYWAESRIPKSDPIAYSRRRTSFIAYGENAGSLELPDGTLFTIYQPDRDIYGNDYIGYIKAYIQLAKSFVVPTALADFKSFQDSVITMGKNATLALNMYSRDNMTLLSDDETTLVDVPASGGSTIYVDDMEEEYIRSVLPVNEEEQAVLLTKTLSMEQENSAITMDGGILAAETIKLGNGATLETTGNQNAIFANSISFGDNGTYSSAEDFDKIVRYRPDGSPMYRTVPSTITILEGDMIFGNDGYFSNKSVFKARKLDMNDRAKVDVKDEVWAEIWVGNDSTVNILPMSERGYLNGISNGLFKKEGTHNVIVNSTAKNFNMATDSRRVYNENYLLNGVNVDEIHILEGGLLMGTTQKDSLRGDIHGNILMNNDTWVHFMGNNVRIWDPIARENNAKNTLVWIDLDDNAWLDTLNTIDSDDVLISGGVLNVHHLVTAPTITLDEAGSLRVYDNMFVHADVVEYEGSGANTTLFLTPRFEYIDSFGQIKLDRIIVENGSFNTYHKIIARGENDGRPEGIWLGSDTTINIHSDVHTSRLTRREDLKDGNDNPIIPVNTTATLDNGLLTIDNSMDVDTLTLTNGTFNFRNMATQMINERQKTAYVTNNISIGPKVIMWINGEDNDDSGHFKIGGGSGLLTTSGAHLGLSPINLAATTAPGAMHLDANLVMNNTSILDLRTSDLGSDKVIASGSAALTADTRLYVRNVKPATDYLLMSALGGLSIPSSFATSFLWHDVQTWTPEGQNLWLNIGSITTLKEELERGNVSNNTRLIGSYISDTWDGSFGPWDDIFFATSLGDAVTAISKYIPEGYINAPQAALRTTTTFQNIMTRELDDMRELSVYTGKSRQQTKKTYKRSSYYSGRSGGDTMYRSYVGSRQRLEPNTSRSPVFASNHKSWRTDKGGMWAKPFYVNATQDKDQGIAGYEYKAWGVSAGIDRRFGRWTWGLSGVYANGDYNTDNDVIKADTDTWGVGLYGTYRPSRSAFFMNLSASYAVNKNDSRHRIEAANATLKSDYDVKSLGAGMAFGYDFALAQSLFLTPKIGVNYTYLSSDEIKEEGSSPIVVRVKNPKLNSIQLPIEVRLSFPIEARRFELLPELHARYTHDFGDTEYKSKVYLNGSNDPLKLDSLAMPENLFTLGGSMGFTSGAHEFSGSYDYDFGDGLTSHLFNLGYKYLF